MKYSLIIIILISFSCTSISRKLASIPVNDQVSDSKKIIYFSDAEGSSQSLDYIIEKGLLKQNSTTNELNFIDDNSILVFGGDLAGRGVNGRRLTKQLNNLSLSYPKRVVLIMGNHEANRLAILRDILNLSKLNQSKNSDYSIFIKDYLSQTKEDITETGDIHIRLKYVMKKMGLEDHLQNFREELQNEINNINKYSKELTDFEVAIEFIRFHAPEGTFFNFIKSYFHFREAFNTPEFLAEWFHETLKGSTLLDFYKYSINTNSSPNLDVVDYLNRDGEFFSYLSKNQLAFYFNDGTSRVGITHLGLNHSNYGRDLYNEQRVASFPEQARILNEQFSAEIGKIRAGFKIKQFYSELATYADAKWDQGLKSTKPVTHSIVYSYRQKEDGNFRLPDEDTVKFLGNSSDDLKVDIEMVGHSPVVSPLPLKGENYIKIMGDTSFHPKTRASFSTIQNGIVNSFGFTTKGQSIRSTISLDKDNIQGKLYKGYHIIGQVDNGDYVGFKYINGYSIEEVIIPQSHISLSDIKAPQSNINTEITEGSRQIRDYINNKKNIQHLSARDAKDLLKEKFVLNIIGPLLDPGGGTFPEGKIRKIISTALKEINPDEVIIGSGGVHTWIDKIVHEEAKKHDFEIIAYLSSNSLSSEIGSADYATISGATYGEGLELGYSLTTHNQSATFFFAGREEINSSVSYHKNNNRFFLAGDLFHDYSRRALDDDPERRAFTKKNFKNLMSHINKFSDKYSCYDLLIKVLKI